MLPLSYVLRNTRRRRVRTALTVAGIALVVAVYFLMASVAETLVRSFRSTGAADEVVLVQAGALAVSFSNVDRATLTWVQTLDGVANDEGRPLVSPELALSSMATVGGRERKVSLRGVTSIAPSVYRQVRLADGRWPGPGRRAAIGSVAAAKLGVGPGDRLRVEGDTWEIVGILDSSGRVYDQELWLDLDELAAAANRTTYSGYTVRASSAAAVPRLVEVINEGRRFPLSAQPATDFYQRTAGMAFFMASLGELIAFVVAIGAVFGGMDTMYAAVASRRREIAVLRALGYRRPAILGAFLLESLLIALVAGVLGILLGSVIASLPYELPFTYGGTVGLAAGQAVSALLLSAVIGLLGGGLPALQAARTPIVKGFR